MLGVKNKDLVPEIRSIVYFGPCAGVYWAGCMPSLLYESQTLTRFIVNSIFSLPYFLSFFKERFFNFIWLLLGGERDRGNYATFEFVSSASNRSPKREKKKIK